jgi:hypothetical protein
MRVAQASDNPRPRIGLAHCRAGTCVGPSMPTISQRILEPGGNLKAHSPHGRKYFQLVRPYDVKQHRYLTSYGLSSLIPNLFFCLLVTYMAELTDGSILNRMLLATPM